MKNQNYTEKIKQLQHHPDIIRNFCILAHVDHGKTSLSDCLISTNNIVSIQNAGKLRHLDFLPAEIERQITMKSSCISLVYKNQPPISSSKKQSTSDKPKQAKQYLINLMDSPGHVDFSFQVSAALRLADNALIVIDTLEGVSPQTITVIRQAWEEKVKTCLVLNKIDRLFIQKYFTGEQIYNHIEKIIQEVNVIISTLINQDFKADIYEREARIQKSVAQKYSSSHKSKKGEDFLKRREDKLKRLKEKNQKIIEELQAEFFFSPQKGNVAFTSAYDGWGFTLKEMAELHAKKRGFKPKVLQQYLWGSYYFNTKTNSIAKKISGGKEKELAVSFIFDPLQKEYQKHFPPGILGNTPELKESRIKIKKILSKRLPIDKTILKMIINHLPSPVTAQKQKLKILNKRLSNDTLVKKLSKRQLILKKSIEQCNPQGITSIYVSKMYKVKPSMIASKISSSFSSSLMINRNNKQQDDQENKTKLIGFARVLSGTLSSGMTLYGHGSVKNTMHKSTEKGDKCVVKNLYIQMGYSLFPVDHVSAGNIVAIGDLDNIILKTGTLHSQPRLPGFSSMIFKSTPILKVAIETDDFTDIPKLQNGLKKLNKADPCVEIYVDDSSGENILAACGEVHLQRCIRDLVEEYALCQINIGEPMFSFKETIVQNIFKRIKKGEKNQVQQGEDQNENQVVVKSNKRTAKWKDQQEGKEEQQEEEDASKNDKILQQQKKQNDTTEQPKDIEQSKQLKLKAKQNEWSGYSDPQDYFPEDFLMSSSSDQQGQNSDKKQITHNPLSQDQYDDDDDQQQKSQNTSLTGNDSISSKQVVGPTFQTQIVGSSTLFSDYKNLYIEKWKRIRERNDSNKGFVTDTTQDGVCRFSVRAIAMPEQLLKFIQTKDQVIKSFTNIIDQNKKLDKQKDSSLIKQAKLFILQFERIIQQIKSSVPNRLIQMIQKHLLGFGPKRCGGNLIASVHMKQMQSFIPRLKILSGIVREDKLKETNSHSSLYRQINTDISSGYISKNDLRMSILQGFQFATASGPIVQEQMLGVCFLIEQIQFINIGANFSLGEAVSKISSNQNTPSKGSSTQLIIDEQVLEENKDEDEQNQEEDQINKNIKCQILNQDTNLQLLSNSSSTQLKTDDVKSPKLDKQTKKQGSTSTSVKASPAIATVHGLFSGQIMSTIKHLCRRAFITAQPRIMEAMLQCSLRVQTNKIGQIYSLINKYRGRVHQQQSQFQSQAFILHSFIPVIESFKFTDQLSNISAGIAYPQMTFSHWDLIDDDPFYIPISQDDLQDYGDNIFPPNVPKRIIDGVRKRKGLPLENKIIVDADKQRNLGKMK